MDNDNAPCGEPDSHKRLQDVVRAHCDDLRQCVSVLSADGGFDRTAREIDVAITELETAADIRRAALNEAETESKEK